jgi:hypothetical protein
MKDIFTLNFLDHNIFREFSGHENFFKGGKIFIGNKKSIKKKNFCKVNFQDFVPCDFEFLKVLSEF